MRNREEWLSGLKGTNTHFKGRNIDAFSKNKVGSGKSFVESSGVECVFFFFCCCLVF